MAHQVMGNAEGAAWRIQLEAMVNVLRAQLDDADACDSLAVSMLDHLVAAQTAAKVIEQRGQQAPTYQGVRLVKS